MNPETYATKASAIAIEPDRDQSHADRALMELEKADADLAHVINILATRLRPVSATEGLDV